MGKPSNHQLWALYQQDMWDKFKRFEISFIQHTRFINRNTNTNIFHSYLKLLVSSLFCSHLHTCRFLHLSNRSEVFTLACRQRVLWNEEKHSSKETFTSEWRQQQREELDALLCAYARIRNIEWPVNSCPWTDIWPGDVIYSGRQCGTITHLLSCLPGRVKAAAICRSQRGSRATQAPRQCSTFKFDGRRGPARKGHWTMFTFKRQEMCPSNSPSAQLARWRVRWIRLVMRRVIKKWAIYSFLRPCGSETGNKQI